MRRLFIFLSILLFYLAFFPQKTLAARLSFDPVTKVASIGASFQVAVRVDTAAVPTTSVDALISFDDTILEVVSIEKGGFYPENFKNIGSGRLYLGGTVKEVLDTRTGTGILSTVTFRGKRIGLAKVGFDCTPGKTTDSNITKNDPDATDVLDCSQLVSGSYEIEAGVGGQTTPTPTASPTATPSATPTIGPTATPSQLPVVGFALPGLIILGTGLAAVFIALLLAF